MRLKSIEEEWSEFSGMIYRGVDPPAIQIKETKQAFFAGAWAMLCAMRLVGVDDSISEDQACQYFEACQREGEQFYKSLMREYVERN